jgi:hypothetical protein
MDCFTSTKMSVLVEDTNDVSLRGLQNSSSRDDGKISHGMLGNTRHVSMTQSLFKYSEIATTNTTISTSVDEGALVCVTSSVMELIRDVNCIGNMLVNLANNRYLVSVDCRRTKISIG